MASKDSTVLLYGGSIRLEYKDKAHRYYVSELEADGSWSKPRSTKGVTTMMDNVLEKKGLMTWPMGLALRELFGFYDFTNDQGDRLTGFSKGVGTMWRGDEIDVEINKENGIELILSAHKAWQRRKQTGADIGSIVHEAIENYVKGLPFSITVEQYKIGQEFETLEAEAEWDAKAQVEVDQAVQAFGKFTEWWDMTKPKLLGAEAQVYSREMKFSGTFDLIYELDGKRILGDNKTSNASTSKEAAAPEGVYYSYFIQGGLYALALQEMGEPPIDDLSIISCRKDGNFNVIYASELGLSVQDCMDWGAAVVLCYNLAVRTKKALLEHPKKEQTNV